MGRDTAVLVIGGGSTGCGIARDLARRGVDVTLVERGTLTDGTTGRMHGLLHSGARYAVSDPTSARDCMAENEILRSIAEHCIEPTGGLFVAVPDDSDAYFEQKAAACRDCGIPVEECTGEEARTHEPSLSSAIERALQVPDAAIDPFRLCVANAMDAERHGATILTHTTVTDLLTDGATVTGATLEHEESTETLTAEYVVNAAGAWSGQLAGMADCQVSVRPSKGAMTIMNVREIDTVINHCRPKGDADIIVPHETTAILGTTDVPVDDPDDYTEARWEVDHLIDTLGELVPAIRDARTIRSFWGVRPLYEPPGAETTDSADLTRDYFVLDHAERDGVDGLVTIVGGKFTTYRLMAEEVADHVCAELGVTASCDTGSVPLPGSEDHETLEAGMERFGLRSPIAKRSNERLGSRTDAVLDHDGPNPVICACEAVTRAEVQDAIDQAGADLHGVRIRTRASMGNCQGGQCAHAMANELAPQYAEPTVSGQLESLLAERWKGQRHALWGEQLAQAMLTYAHHATTLNHDAEGAAVDVGAFDAGPPDGGDGGDR